MKSDAAHCLSCQSLVLVGVLDTGSCERRRAEIFGDDDVREEHVDTTMSDLLLTCPTAVDRRSRADDALYEPNAQSTTE